MGLLDVQRPREAPPYPSNSAERTRWIIENRPAHNRVDATQPLGFFLEEEPDEQMRLVTVATIFLANRECPWKCVFCDLWKNTLDHATPPGAVPDQIRIALSHLPLPPLPAPLQVKLYNSGSFFDPRAVPRSDYKRIAQQLKRFQRVIVECHPKLVGTDTLRFRDLVARELPLADPHPLEVAMGLETAHPETLERLNKKITLRDFEHAATLLASHHIALRVFLLLHPPFIAQAQAGAWLSKSIQIAFDLGATVVSLIPTRRGNGSLDALEKAGLFTEPTLDTIEQTLQHELPRQSGRLFVDLWDLDRFATCPVCASERVQHIAQANLRQLPPPPLPKCPDCPA